MIVNTINTVNYLFSIECYGNTMKTYEKLISNFIINDRFYTLLNYKRIIKRKILSYFSFYKTKTDLEFFYTFHSEWLINNQKYFKNRKTKSTYIKNTMILTYNLFSFFERYIFENNYYIINILSDLYKNIFSTIFFNL